WRQGPQARLARASDVGSAIAGESDPSHSILHHTTNQQRRKRLAHRVAPKPTQCYFLSLFQGATGGSNQDPSTNSSRKNVHLTAAVSEIQPSLPCWFPANRKQGQTLPWQS